MKVACIVNPLVQANGPGFNYGGVEALAELLQPLRREARCECMLITGGWFSEWAGQNGKVHLLTGLRTVWLDEHVLYRRIRELGGLPTALDQTAHRADDTEQPALGAIAEMVARNVKGFEPDIIIGFAGQANCLAKLWPTALRLHIERGYFGRAPYPVSFYFDHLGTYSQPVQWEDDPSIAELVANLHDMQRERDALLKSTSWRITAPLRVVTQAVRLARLRHPGLKGTGARGRCTRAMKAPSSIRG
jgi:hypothetical protein